MTFASRRNLFAQRLNPGRQICAGERYGSRNPLTGLRRRNPRNCSVQPGDPKDAITDWGDSATTFERIAFTGRMRVPAVLDPLLNSLDLEDTAIGIDGIEGIDDFLSDSHAVHCQKYTLRCVRHFRAGF